MQHKVTAPSANAPIANVLHFAASDSNKEFKSRVLHFLILQIHLPILFAFA